LFIVLVSYVYCIVSSLLTKKSSRFIWTVETDTVTAVSPSEDLAVLCETLQHYK